MDVICPTLMALKRTDTIARIQAQMSIMHAENTCARFMPRLQKYVLLRSTVGLVACNAVSYVPLCFIISFSKNVQNNVLSYVFTNGQSD